MEKHDDNHDIGKRFVYDMPEMKDLIQRSVKSLLSNKLRADNSQGEDLMQRFGRYFGMNAVNESTKLAHSEMPSDIVSNKTS